MSSLGISMRRGLAARRKRVVGFRRNFRRNRATFVGTRGASGFLRSRRAAGHILSSVLDKKGMDTSLTIAGPIINSTGSNGDATVLNLIQQGNGSWNRIGRKVLLKSVRLRGMLRYIYAAQATTETFGTVFARMIVVWDKQPSGAAIPTFDTIFGNTVQDGTETSTTLDGLKYDNTGRFKVLRDKFFTPQLLATPATGGTTNQVSTEIIFDEYIKLNKRTIFSGQSDPMTIADISTGALYVYWRAYGSSDGFTDWAVMSGSLARLRYQDF